MGFYCDALASGVVFVTWYTLECRPWQLVLQVAAGKLKRPPTKGAVVLSPSASKGSNEVWPPSGTENDVNRNQRQRRDRGFL